jgi:hypothetical protein
LVRSPMLTKRETRRLASGSSSRRGAVAMIRPPS